jgi:hypothetical protein
MNILHNVFKILIKNIKKKLFMVGNYQTCGRLAVGSTNNLNSATLVSNKERKRNGNLGDDHQTFVAVDQMLMEKV